MPSAGRWDEFEGVKDLLILRASSRVAARAASVQTDENVVSFVARLLARRSLTGYGP